jgi:hypothetical protein
LRDHCRIYALRHVCRFSKPRVVEGPDLCARTGATSSPRRSRSSAVSRKPASGPNNPTPPRSVPCAVPSVARCPRTHQSPACLVPATPG